MSGSGPRPPALDLVHWLGSPPAPLARALDRRLDLFEGRYARIPGWPVVALPAGMAEVYRIPAPRAEALAAGCALFFLAADVIDDAQDGDLPDDTPWPEAVNAGQALLFGAIGAFGEAAPGLPVAREVHEAGRSLAAGQAIDLALTWDSPPSEDTVMAAVRGKAGASVSLFARLGAHAAQRPPAEVAAWGAFGEALGMAIQLRSDVVDLGQAESRDFRARKATLPVVCALGRSGGAFQAAARAGDRAAACAAIRACGGFTLAEFKIDALALEAREAVDRLDLGPADRQRFHDLVAVATAAPVPL